MKKRRHLLIIVVLVAVFASPGVTSESKPPTDVPKAGFVPDQATAIRIAEAVWIPIYGEVQIASEKPFVAELKGDVWVVTGTLQADVDGGVAIAEIAKRDGRIIRVSHGK